MDIAQGFTTNSRVMVGVQFRARVGAEALSVQWIFFSLTEHSLKKSGRQCRGASHQALPTPIKSSPAPLTSREEEAGRVLEGAPPKTGIKPEGKEIGADGAGLRLVTASPNHD